MQLDMHRLQKSYSISDLRHEFSVTLRALRFYESLDLLHPIRHEGKTTRIYSRRDRARLKLILFGKRVGFSLSEIKAMIDLYDIDKGKTQRRVLLEKFREQTLLLEQQLSVQLNALEELKEEYKTIERMER